MLEAVRATSLWTTAKIGAIRQQLDIAAEIMRTKAPRIYSRELVDLIFAQPYCRISDVVAAGLAQRQSASAYLRILVEIGLLSELKTGRDKLFLNPALLAELTGLG